ncbi:MAG: sulfatase-like hydrolase/transferase [Pirellulaceae bacterium]
MHHLRNVALLMLAAFAAPLRADAPNIVFIIADDLGWADVGFHGGNAPTPNLDRLAAEGLELTQHYVAPVCSPTRTGLMTGRCWSRFNVTSPQNNRALPWDTVTLPRALKSVGYDTCLTGKWHLGSTPQTGPNHFGFDYSYGSLAGGVGPWDHAYKQGPFVRTWHRNEQLVTEAGHVTDLITQEAVRWLGERQERPYFLYVPFTAVHLPVKEPDEWLAKVPAGIQGDVARHYAACIMHLDDAVGRIVSAVRESGRANDTLLVFTSDNGGSTAENNGQAYPPDNYPEGPLPGNNRPLRGEKGSLYEGGIRVPTLVSWPGKLKPGKSDVAVQITDWMPTLTALAGYRPVADLRWDGTSIWPAITGEGTLAERALYWTAPGFRSRAVRVGEWKLIAYRGNGNRPKYELFHVARDPRETTDLAAQMPDKVTELSRRLEDMARADGDSAVREPRPQ